MNRLPLLLFGFALAGRAARAQPVVAPMDVAPYQRRAAELFDPKFVSDSASALSTATENLLLMCQAVAAVIVVAGMIAKIRQDHVQMEGIASMMLKVAFIAMIPLLRVQTLETADAAAAALGYEAVSADRSPPALTASVWGLLHEWVPPGSPYLDALETQAAEAPPSGDEEAWALRAWNWARGVGTTTSSTFDAMWQSVSGGMRAGAVFAGCAAMACVTSVTLVLTYLGEVLRYLLFLVGCAVLPVFVAALGVDALRPAAVRFILFVVSIACWPVGWALANGVTTIMVRGLTAWINSVSAVALSVAGGDAVPPLSVAAPYVGWGALFLFMGATVAICLWVAGAVLYAPFAIGRLVSSGGNAVAALVGASAARPGPAAAGLRVTPTVSPVAGRPQLARAVAPAAPSRRFETAGGPGVRPARGLESAALRRRIEPAAVPPGSASAPPAGVASTTSFAPAERHAAALAQWLPPPRRLRSS